MIRYAFAVLVTCFVATSTAVAQPVTDRTLKLDVVELVKGARVDGDTQFTATRGKFTYLFATEENLKAFLGDAERYEVQLGGSCARMGPLSGEGSVRLLAAHDGKVYLFASEACRARFLDSPDAFLNTPEQKPETTDESRKLGRRLLGKAVDAIMCHAMIDGVKTYRETLARDETHGETNYHVTSTLSLRRGDTARWEICWNDICWAYLAHKTGGWTIDPDGTEELNAQQCDELRHNAGRHPYMILWARDSKELIASADGAVRTIDVPGEGELEVELVTVYFQGAITTLGLDASGKIRLMAYRGRGPNSTIGAVEKIYSKFHVMNELRVPGRVDMSFNGEHVEKSSGEFVEQVFDDPADQTKFILADTAMRAHSRAN